MRILLFIQVLIFAGFFMLSAQETADDTNSDGQPDRWVKIDAGKVSEIAMDRDFDGDVDYIIKYDDKSLKAEEQLDFNYDGRIDDYYFYNNGKMIRREIDTNYDDKIDIWVYLDGIYIERYEKDTDFDGEIDIVKDYTGE